MNICLWMPGLRCLPKGGHAVQIIETAKAIEKLGYKVFLKTTSDHKHLKDFDVIHLFVKAYTYIKIAHSLSKPIVWSPIYWGLSNYHKQGRHYQCYDNCFREAEAVIFLGKREKQDAISAGFKNQKNCYIVHNGVEASLFKDLPINKKESKIIQVGPYCGLKNQLATIKVAKEYNIPIDFYGRKERSDYNYYDKCIKEASNHNIKFNDWIPHEQMIEVFKKASIVMQPSTSEVASLACIEGAAAGCHVITTKVGCIEEYLGGYGFYCTSSLSSMKETLNKVLKTPLNDKLHKFILNNFTWKQTGQKLITIYEKVLKNPKYKSCTIFLKAEDKYKTTIDTKYVNIVRQPKKGIAAFYDNTFFDQEILNSLKEKNIKIVFKLSSFYYSIFYEMLQTTFTKRMKEYNSKVLFCLKNADFVIYSNIHIKNKADALYFREKNFDIIQNNVDLEFFKYRGRNRKLQNVGIFGPFEYPFQINSLFEIFFECKRKNYSMNLFFIGKINKECQKHFRDNMSKTILYKLQDNIYTYFSKPDAKKRLEIYNKLDALYHPLPDDWQNIVLESFVCGVPIICIQGGSVGIFVGNTGKVLEVDTQKKDYITSLSKLGAEQIRGLFNSYFKYQDRIKTKIPNLNIEDVNLRYKQVFLKAQTL